MSKESPRAEVVAIGSELVSGQRLDTNSQWLSQKLGDLGISVRYHTTLGDDLDDFVRALRVASERADLVILGGGLGPTQDDLTREALARVAGVALVEDSESLAAIEGLFARRSRTMPERNRIQALRPEHSEPLPNRVGTAPGIWMTLGSATFACLPGVPVEMRVMFDEQVVPRLQGRGITPGRVIAHRVVNMFGRGESDIEADAMDLTVRGRRPEVGIYASDATISFRVTCDGATEADALHEIEPTLELIRRRFGDLIVGEAEGEDVAEAVVRELARTGTTLATAESCTGGLIARGLTKIPGVSTHFLGGVVAYSNEVKQRLLGVQVELLDEHGAVSAPVAEAMAAGARERLGADVAVSVTGVAGPSGGSLEKPVGLVYIGLATPRSVSATRFELGPEQPRAVIQSRASKHAQNLVRLLLRHWPVRENRV